MPFLQSLPLWLAVVAPLIIVGVALGFRKPHDEKSEDEKSNW